MKEQEEKVLIISNQDNEECWQDYQEVSLFAYWNGPTMELYNVIDWLEEFYGYQVSISH